MHLISTLCAGVAGAANGWAELYVRGTSTRATWYPDFEASTSNSSGANITLDAYGAVEVYVNQLVDVIVKSSDGTTVRSFTDGYASPNVEVISPSFTGTDYVSAASAVNEPTTLQSVLNLWVTNAGSPDWKVDVGGVDTTLSDIAGSLIGLVFNVKSPAYGAVGDGVTNDQAAIQDALSAAVSAGGGIVFFPKGTYLTTTAIEWDHRVSMVGVGVDLSVITTSSASNARVITLTSGTSRNVATLISGMSFASTVTNSGTQFFCSVAVNLAFEKCRFGASASSTGIGIDLQGSNSIASFRDCVFTLNGSVYGAVGTSGATSRMTFERCLFKTTGGTFGAGMYRHDAPSRLVDCDFDLSSVTIGTNTGIESASTNDLFVWGCRFITSGGLSFTQCVSFLGGMLAVVDGCNFGNSPPYSLAGSVLGNGSRLQLLSDQNVSSSATPSISTGYANAYMVSTTTVPTWTLPAKLFPGQTLTVVAINNSGAGWGSPMSFPGAINTTNLGSPSIANTASGLVQFIVSDVGTPGTYEWRGIFATG